MTRALVLIVAALALAACGSRSETVAHEVATSGGDVAQTADDSGPGVDVVSEQPPEPTSTQVAPAPVATDWGPIGELAAPQEGEMLGFVTVPDPPLARSLPPALDCVGVATLAGVLRHLPAPPPEAGTPICFADGGLPGELPDPVTAAEWSVTTLYVPPDFDPQQHSFTEILDSGGIAITLFFGTPDDLFTTGDNPDDSAGGYATRTIDGRQMLIHRNAHLRVNAVWLEERPPLPSIILNPGLMRVIMTANVTPDEMAVLASQLEEGPPPFELPLDAD